MPGATAKVHFLWHRRIDAFGIIAAVIIREAALHFNMRFSYKYAYTIGV